MEAITNIRVQFIFLLLGLSGGSVFAQDDLAAIKNVIIKETEAFIKVDYKAWSDTWLKVPYAYWSYSDTTTTSFAEGWDTLNKTYTQYFKDSRPSLARISYEWIEIRVYQNGALARFIQRLSDDIDTEETSQVRILEKIGGQWKVVCVWAIAQNSKKK